MKARGREKLSQAIGYLREQAARLETADEREPLLLSCSVMKFILDGWHICPWRTAFVYRYGRHPEYVIPFWLRRAAEHRTTAMPLTVVPDYDPSVESESRLGRQATGRRPVLPLSEPSRSGLKESVLQMPLPRTGTK
jgi:hypothetical protein